MTSIRALEFFSGIGGLHFGFNASNADGQVLESFDMNQQANDTYKLSFGKSPVSRGIDRLTVKEIEKYNANCWLMSPPCQPYTRGGKLLDDQDNRAKPLLHLLDQLEKMSTPPQYLFLENVKNFETSRSRHRLVTLLHKMGYVFRECLLAPYNFGVPNDRLRYFLMARLRSSFGAATTVSASIDDKTILNHDFDPEKEIIYTTWPFPAFVEDPKKSVYQYPFNIPELHLFLDEDKKDEKDYLLSRQLILERPNFRFDILQPSSTRSACFTKAYGSHHVAGGGSLLQTQKMDQTEYDFGNSESIVELGLRFLTPTEVARIHVFPLDERHDSLNPFESLNSIGGGDVSKAEQSTNSTLTTVRPFNPRVTQGPKGPFLRFPDKLKAIQRYKLLGNSLNVWVVAELLRGVLFADHPGAPQPEHQSIDITTESNTSIDAQSAATGSNDNVAVSNGGKHDMTALEEESSKIQDKPQEDKTARETKRARVD
ncbi:tRNA (cytosine-5-)-methyltransferase [Linnemannia zychae]|nr:tRNA (cytosine-5-)-methyltransferase [Linnemannia zychae]